MDTPREDVTSRRLVRRGRQLEAATLSWNVVGVAVLAVAAIGAKSVALAGFGLDSVIEIGASSIVLWELAGVDERRQQHALKLIGVAFVALGLYLAVQGTWVLAIGFRPHHSQLGIFWTGATAVAMFALAAGKTKVGRELDNRVLTTEGRVTLVDAILATAVLVGLVLNSLLGWWWADPAAGYLILYYALREAKGSFAH